MIPTGSFFIRFTANSLFCGAFSGAAIFQQDIVLSAKKHTIICVKNPVKKLNLSEFFPKIFKP
ncbi:MAG TPA: hypothetical protein PKY59_16665, partial [Pyrinomonadaceae bacterium]|nr:hypothetical protein [Pyrinomonadaceae bacterium]